MFIYKGGLNKSIHFHNRGCAVPPLALLLMWRAPSSHCAPVIATYPPDYGVCDCYYTGVFSYPVFLVIGLGSVTGVYNNRLKPKNMQRAWAVAGSPLFPAL